MRLWPFGSERTQSRDAAPTPAAEPFAPLVEAFPDPLMIVRADHRARRIVFANAAARDFFRLTGEAPMLIAAIRRPEVLEVIEASLTEGREGEAAFELQDRVLRALIRPIPPAADGALQALVVIRDETEARRSDRMRADFMANASHELRTPLASITGFIETLQGHAKDDEAARGKFLGIMSAQAERMGRLIDDLMSLSRIELNERVPPDGQVDVNQVAADVADALAPLARKIGGAIKYRAGPTGALVTGERDQIVQVVQNLIDNALKFSPAGALVTLEVTGPATAEQATAARDEDASRLILTSPEHDPDARYVVVRIADQGPGIARDQLPRLTERFYRAPGQKSGERSGTGLGLAIVKHIVQRHRGGLAVESAPGRGAAFTVYLPLRRD
jgi:two-component system phosphate regulon sensor histidine kinase PhoR